MTDDDDRTLRAHEAAKHLIAYYELPPDDDVSRLWHLAIIDALLSNQLDSIDWHALARREAPRSREPSHGLGRSGEIQSPRHTP